MSCKSIKAFFGELTAAFADTAIFCTKIEQNYPRLSRVFGTFRSYVSMCLSLNLLSKFGHKIVLRRFYNSLKLFKKLGS